MQNLDGIQVPGARLPYVKYDYVSSQNANYNEADCFRGNFSICYLQGTSFLNANLKEASMLCTTLSNSMQFNDADVSGLLLLATHNIDGSPIDRKWLKEHGAQNTNSAITSLVDLNEMLQNKKIEVTTAELYRDRINKIFGLINSMRIRFENNMEIKPEWMELLKQATSENLAILQAAYVALDIYIIKQVVNSNYTANLNTLKRMALQNFYPKRLTYEFRPSASDQFFKANCNEKYKKSAQFLAQLLTSEHCPKNLIIDLKYNNGKVLSILFNELGAKPCKTNLHIIIGPYISNNDFSKIIQLLSSSTCPNGLRIDFRSAISSEQFSTIVSTINGNLMIKDLNLGFHVNNNSLANIILDNEEAAITNVASRVHLTILSHYELDMCTINRINKLQTRYNALGCMTLLQGNRDGNHKLSIIPKESLNQIFDYTMDPLNDQKQRTNYINNIYKRLPVGKFFETKAKVLQKPSSQPRQTFGGLKNGFLKGP